MIKGKFGRSALDRRRGGGNQLVPAARAYIARVIADGGTVADQQSVNRAFKMIATQGLSVAAAYSSDWGYKVATGVSKLYSLAGAGSDLIQATGGAQPVWAANQQNGKPTITFDGTNHFMKSATFTWNQPAVVIMTVKQVSWKASGHFYDGDATNSMALSMAGSSPQIQGYNGASVFANISNLAVGSWGVITTRWQQNNNLLRVNGTGIGVLAGGTGNPSGFTLGRVGAIAGSTYCGNISVGEIFLLNADTANYANVESYLKNKWGTP